MIWKTNEFVYALFQNIRLFPNLTSQKYAHYKTKTWYITFDMYGFNIIIKIKDYRFDASFISKAPILDSTTL